MKKLSLILAATAMTASAFAGSALPTKITFSSVGPDYYSDNALVADGEVYALIWVKNGAEFKGITAKGEPVDPETTRVIAALPVAVNHHCPYVTCTLSGDDATLPDTGSFSLYLLDTRVASKNAEGERVVEVSGVGSEMDFESVNKITSVVLDVNGKTLSGASGAVTAAGAVATAVPGDTPNPVVDSIKVVNGKVVVKVSNTVPYLQYGVSAGKTPSQLDQKELIEGLNGSSEGLTLVVDDPAEYRFFKVIRK